MKPLLFFLFLPIAAFSQFSLNKVFQNNMVLQANKRFDFAGKGIPGSSVTLLLSSQTKQTKVKGDSTWKISMSAQASSQTPETLLFITGKDTLKLSNILFGEVWLCIGQSNMEFPLRSEKHFQPKLIEEEVPYLRFYNPQFIGKNFYGKPYTDSMKSRLQTKDVLTGRWESSKASAAADMSAIGYYFGRWIADSLKQPAGMIHLSIGGSPIETWMDATQLAKDSRFKEKTALNWTENAALPVWIRQRAIENIGISNPDGAHTFQPGYAFETMVKDLAVLPIRGILFYQGESNAQELDRVIEYPELMKQMVNDYRKIWKENHLPFYYVQLSSIDSIKYKSQLWPTFRSEQLNALKLIPHSGMAVSHDKGFLNDVHPTDKKTIAERLSKWAAHQLYGQKHTMPSGPLPVKATVKKGYVVIAFNYTGKKLGTSDGKEVRGCSLDGKNSATAIIKRKKLVLKTDTSHGIVHYCYQPYCDANLVNEQGLPAPGFQISY